MIQLCRQKLSDFTRWDELVRSHPGGTIFHTRAWLEAVARNHPLQPNHLTILRDGQVVGVLPMFIRRFGLMKVAGSPFVVEDTPYMGPVVAPELLPEVLEALERYLQGKRINFFRGMLRDLPQGESLCRVGKAVPRHTHLLDLAQEEEDLWRGLAASCRNKVRKAQKAGVQIEPLEERSELEEYFTILEQMYLRQNLPVPNPKGFFLDLWDALAGRQLFVLRALHQGRMIAGAIFIVDGGWAYYLNGTSREEARNLGPNNLLQWEGIRLSRRLGARRYDFVGSDIPRLAAFKKSFGGELTRYTCVEMATSRWAALLRDKYPVYKQKFARYVEWMPTRP